MKLVVVALLAIAIAVLAEPMNPSTLQKYFDECLTELDIKQDEMGELEKKKDRKFQCFPLCIFQKGGIIENGELKKDMVVQFLNVITSDMKETNVTEAEVIAKVESCEAEVKNVTDSCDRTRTLIDCISEEKKNTNA